MCLNPRCGVIRFAAHKGVLDPAFGAFESVKDET